MTSAATWAAMNPAEQLRMIHACLRKAAPACDPADLTGEVWIKATETMQPARLAEINGQRANEGKTPLSLVSIVFRAARAALAASDYANQKHAVASVRSVGDEDAPAVETIAAGHYDTEHAAIVHLQLEEMMEGRDEIDRSIVAGLWLGFSLREIAAVVGLSHVAVRKRVLKMRAVLAA